MNMIQSKSAKEIMTARVPVVSLHATIGEIESLLLKNRTTFDSIDYVYIIDKEQKLKGVISVREIFNENKSVSVQNVMERNVISVRPHTYRERIAYLALKHNIKSLPVVDKTGVFLGVVLNDTILRTLYEEASEDLLHLAGAGHGEKASFDDILKISAARSLRHRLPWLFAGLLGGITVAGIIGRFEALFNEYLMLAAFIPLMTFMADAIRLQTEAFVIRDLAVNPSLRFGHYFARHFLITFLLGIAVSIAVFTIHAALYADLRIGAVLGVSLFAAILSSIITGLLVPYLFSRIRLDPANASGPVATILQDIVSITIYLGVATVFLV